MLTLPWLIIMLVHGPRFWKWVLFPGILYTIEKILRYRKSRSNKHGESFIMEAILLPSQVDFSPTLMRRRRFFQETFFFFSHRSFI